MPTGNDIITARQVIPQRAAVETSSRRDGAEPIGRDFADLVAEARSNEPDKPTAPEKETTAQTPTEPGQPKETATSPKAPTEQEAGEKQASFSAELPEGDDPAAFLVANAAFSETPVPVAGLLNLAPNLPTQTSALTQTVATPESGGDILVDTSTLFAAPNLTKPAETATIVQPAQIPGTPAQNAEANPAAQAIASSFTAPTTKQAPTLTASTQLDAAAQQATPEQPKTVGGPGANRFDASLARGNAPEGITTQLNQPAQNMQSTPAGSPAGAAQQAPAAKAGAQPAAVIPATLDASLPSPVNNSTSLITPAAATPGSSSVAQSTAAAASSHTPPPTLASAPQAAVQVYSRFVERFDGRAQQFQVRLDPPELGRVNVRIEIGSDHRVHAVLATHDNNALSDLLRGQRALEQSLADAGIDLAEGGIRFELSDNGTQHSSTRENEDAPPRSTSSLQVDEAGASTDTNSPPPRWSRSRINIVA